METNKQKDAQHDSPENPYDEANTPVTEPMPVYKHYAEKDGDDEDDRENEQDDQDEQDYDEEDEDTPGDWGSVDPLEHPGPPSNMDPSAPGSAV